MKKMRRHIFASLALGLVLLLFITSCSSTESPSTLKSILVIPVNTSIQVGRTQQYMAIAAYSDGSTANITGDVTWTSSDSAVASIDTLGLARAKAVGTTTITATLEGISGSATLTVIAPPTLESISVKPESALIQVDKTRQFTATGIHSDGSTADITGDITWASSKPAVATIDTEGLASAKAVGTTTITAPLEGISGSATLTVTELAPTLESISVTPESASIEVGQTQQYTATGTYSGGSTAVITAEVTWASSDTAVATITSAGLATAVGAGTTTITATLDTVSGTAALTATTPTGAPNIPAGHYTAGCSNCHSTGVGGAPQWPANHTAEWTCENCHQGS